MRALRRRHERIQVLLVAVALAGATAGGAGAGAVGGPEYGIVRMDERGPDDRGAAEAEMDRCLRAHGWVYGSPALMKMELRVGHPNGLKLLCAQQVSSPSRATPAGENGRIAYRLFLNEERTRAAILTVDPDGSARQWVTHPARAVAHLVPDWSPDGHWIAYIRVHEDFWDTRERRKRPRIFRIHPNGEGVKDLSASCMGRCRHDDEPAWSPNGRRIAFVRVFRNPAEVDLMVMRADGTHVRHLTRHPSGEVADWQPQWAPNGQRVVFMRYNGRRDASAVFTMRIDGSGLRRVTSWYDEFTNLFPDWSPNGRWIAFRTGAGALWLVHPNGESRRGIAGTDGGMVEWASGSFSPDGTMIVWSRTGGAGPAGSFDVFRMNVEGSGLVNVTQSTRWDGAPDWGPRRR